MVVVELDEICVVVEFDETATISFPSSSNCCYESFDSPFSIS